jgi:hypothetical protein
VIYTFIAKGLMKTSEQTLDSGERIALKPASFDELLLIAQDERFAEKDIVTDLLRAHFDAEHRKKIEALFSPRSAG